MKRELGPGGNMLSFTNGIIASARAPCLPPLKSQATCTSNLKGQACDCAG